MKTSVGVDGCKAGWLAVSVTDDGEWARYESARALLDRYGDVGRVLIDIPIGLVEGKPKERKCDLEARRLLGKPVVLRFSQYPAERPCRLPPTKRQSG